MIEEWRDITQDNIPNVKNCYMVSNFGKVYNKKTKKIVSDFKPKICISLENGKETTAYVPKVMLKAFNPELIIRNDQAIWFKDNNKNNIMLDNICVVPKSYLKEIYFNNNAIKNSGLSNKQMSMANYYQNRNNLKMMCYYANETWAEITDKAVNMIRPWYMISNFGRVYSKATNSIVKQTIINSGYYRVQLYTTTGEKVDLLTHRLMMMVYYPLDDYTNMEVNHKDGNPFNNSLYNLEWMTKIDNILYTIDCNSDRYKRSLSIDEVNKICKSLEDGMSYKDICLNILNEEYTARLHSRIYDIHKRKTYVNISNKYKF